MTANRVADSLLQALQGDATAAADMWRAIDAGVASDADTVAWARSVASQVVAKVLDSPLDYNHRRDAAYVAIGFEDRIDRQRHLRNEIRQMHEMLQGEKNMTRKEFVRICRLVLNDFDGLDDDAAAKRIDRLLRK